MNNRPMRSRRISWGGVFFDRFHPGMARLWLLLGLTLVGLGCAARHPAAPEVVMPPAYATVDPELDAAQPALSGFDPLEEKPDVGAGDRVVMGLRIQKNGREQVRFVEL